MFIRPKTSLGKENLCMVKKILYERLLTYSKEKATLYVYGAGLTKEKKGGYIHELFS